MTLEEVMVFCGYNLISDTPDAARVLTMEIERLRPADHDRVGNRKQHKHALNAIYYLQEAVEQLRQYRDG